MTKIAWGEPRTVLKERSGMVFSCWRPNLWERLRILFTGRVYVQADTPHAKALSSFR